MLWATIDCNYHEFWSEEHNLLWWIPKPHLKKWPRNFHYFLLHTIRMTVFREEDRFIRKTMNTFGKVLENTKTVPKGYPLPNFNPITALI